MVAGSASIAAPTLLRQASSRRPDRPRRCFAMKGWSVSSGGGGGGRLPVASGSLISLSALGSSQSVRGSCLHFSILMQRRQAAGKHRELVETGAAPHRPLRAPCAGRPERAGPGSAPGRNGPTTTARRRHLAGPRGPGQMVGGGPRRSRRWPDPAWKRRGAGRHSAHLVLVDPASGRSAGRHAEPEVCTASGSVNALSDRESGRTEPISGVPDG
jgi:hypothetical protein